VIHFTPPGPGAAPARSSRATSRDGRTSASRAGFAERSLDCRRQIPGGSQLSLDLMQSHRRNAQATYRVDLGPSNVEVWSRGRWINLLGRATARAPGAPCATSGIHRRPPRLPVGRCKPAAVLRHATGFPGLGLLRRLRPVPPPPTDTAPRPPRADGGTVPTFTAVRSTGQAPGFLPAVKSWRSRSHTPRTAESTKCSPSTAGFPRSPWEPAHRFADPHPSGWSRVEP
jgi:hypothetical protein